MRNIAAMVSVGGVLFILEGERPPAGSASEAELYDVMSEFGTLESPFDYGHLRQLLEDNGFFVTIVYASVTGLCAPETIDDGHLPLRSVALNSHLYPFKI